MKSIPVLLLASSLILISSLSSAQVPQVQQRPPDGGTREVLVSILIPSLPNAPFTATVNAEWKRQLADGTTITRGNRRAIARDKWGRIFQERRVLVPQDVKQESVVAQIEISDPVSHKLYTCVPNERVCQLELFSEPVFVPPAKAGTENASRQPGSPTVEDLGKQSVGGLETVGTREITFIETGAMGNDSPMLVKREFWYSPRLDVNLISKVQDPRFGTQNFEVSEIALGDPDPKLFQLPSNASVIDLRKPVKVASPH